MGLFTDFLPNFMNSVQYVCCNWDANGKTVLLILLAHAGVSDLQWDGGTVPAKSDCN